MPVMMIAKFKGDPEQLTHAYDVADAELEKAMGTRMPPGALHHVSAPAADGLYIVDVWESEQALRGMLESPEFGATLSKAGFPPADQAEIQILPVHTAMAGGAVPV